MRLILSSNFQRKLDKLLQKEPQLKNRINKTFRFMLSDLNYPALRLHKLSGTNIWSVSVDMENRIIFSWEKDGLFLLDIGSHDEVY
jgi:mRNA-degrading endonuclease YafQ of YafQ-DinJ toxin-antitoxin module